MVETTHLAPHDPLPEAGRHVLVLRRLGKDDPGAMVTEIITAHATMPAVTADGHAMGLAQAVTAAEAEAGRLGMGRVYVVDRTAGKLEQEALHDHGGRSFAADQLDDSDPEDGEAGADIRDRPHDAGYVR